MILSAERFLFVFKRGRAKVVGKKVSFQLIRTEHFFMFKSDISVIVTGNEVLYCALTIELYLGGDFLLMEVFKWDVLRSS